MHAFSFEHIWQRARPSPQPTVLSPAVESCVLSPSLIQHWLREDLTIRELAELVAEVVGFKGNLAFDTSKPDGTMRKVMDVSRINALGWHRTMLLKDGIALSYLDMLSKI